MSHGSNPPPPPPPPIKFSLPHSATSRWLIQRDHLELGPLDVQEIRHLLQTGQCSQKDILVDQTTGQRGPIGEHALFKAFAAELETERHRLRGAEADVALHATESRRRKIAWILGSMLCGIAAAALWGWVAGKRLDTTQDLRETAGPSLEGAAHSVDFVWRSPDKRKRNRKPRPSGGAAPASVDEFDAPMELGSADRPGGDEQLSDQAISQVMLANFHLLKGCALAERHRNAALREVEIEFVVHGDGKVTSLRANDQKTGPLATCLFDKMQKIAFPKYEGPRTIAEFSMTIR